MAGEARVAIYYAPPPDDPLALAGAAWLGRDPEANVPVPQPDLPGIAEITADPRRYGFHATLKPPMRLAAGCGWAGFVDAVRRVAERVAPIELPPLQIADLSGFLAIREATRCPGLHRLCDIWVEALDAWRAPLSAGELARRRAAPLTPEQDAMLLRWGYPYVFETWFFHMTLTRRLSAAEMHDWRPQAEAHFAPCLSCPRRITDVCIFSQAAPEHPFVIAERLPLLG